MLAKALGGHRPPCGARVGLLGGSFNPAHSGHRQISLEALRRLRLDEVWWLVSPQNPLKARAGMAPLAQRIARAEAVAAHPRLRVAALEDLLGTAYTAETLSLLTRYFPARRFVWLMGADNLRDIEKWAKWPQIFNSVGVAVFNRPTYALEALAGKAARRFGRYRLDEASAWRVAEEAPPAWVFIHSRLNPISATRLRAGEPKGVPAGCNDFGEPELYKPEQKP